MSPYIADRYRRLSTPSSALLALMLLGCNTAAPCQAEDDPAVTQYYNIECDEHERSFIDDCGCGCLQR